MTIASEAAVAAVMALAQAMTAEAGRHVHLAVLVFTVEDGRMDNAEALTSFGNNHEGLAQAGEVMMNIGKRAAAEEGLPPEEPRIVQLN